MSERLLGQITSINNSEFFRFNMDIVKRYKEIMKFYDSEYFDFVCQKIRQESEAILRYIYRKKLRLKPGDVKYRNMSFDILKDEIFCAKMESYGNYLENSNKIRKKGNNYSHIDNGFETREVFEARIRSEATKTGKDARYMLDILEKVLEDAVPIINSLSNNNDNLQLSVETGNNNEKHLVSVLNGSKRYKAKKSWYLDCQVIPNETGRSLILNKPEYVGGYINLIVTPVNNPNNQRPVDFIRLYGPIQSDDVIESNNAINQDRQDSVDDTVKPDNKTIEVSDSSERVSVYSETAELPHNETLQPEKTITEKTINRVIISQCKEAFHEHNCSAIIKHFFDDTDAVFEGEWIDGKPDGTGKLIAQNGTTFECEWNCGMPSREGTLILPNNIIYKGTWGENSDSGKGTINLPDGSKFKGEWLSLMPHGKGKLTKANGTVYIGGWVNNKREGYGRMTYPNGKRYYGMWHQNKRNGKGLMVSADGSLYTGEWQNNVPTGKGRQLFSDGSIYDGEWLDNKFNGWGKLISSDNTVYIGNWKDGETFGYGMQILQDGTVYLGFWKDGMLNGNGTIINTDASIFKGSFIDGQPNGYGILTANGKEYEGEWENGKLKIGHAH